MVKPLQDLTLDEIAGELGAQMSAGNPRLLGLNAELQRRQAKAAETMAAASLESAGAARDAAKAAKRSATATEEAGRETARAAQATVDMAEYTKRNARYMLASVVVLAISSALSLLVQAWPLFEEATK